MLSLFGATTVPDTVSEQRNCNPKTAVELHTLKPGCHAGFLLRNPRRGFSLSCGIAARSGSGNAGLEASCICIRLYDLRGYIGQQVARGIAHGLHDERTADCARQCAGIAQRKSGGPCATFRTDCTTDEQRIVRGIANGLRDGRAADCSTDYASGPIPGRNWPLFSS